MAIVPRPRGGDWLRVDVEEMKAEGIDVLVSLLKPEEAAELGLADEAGACERVGIEFVSLPVPDRGLPEDAQKFIAVAEDLRARIEAGRSIGIHCRAGIGRSSLLAAAILVLSGSSPGDAWTKITKARGLPVPDTAEQRRWLDSIVPSAKP
jgi:protein-tyrosine phosphatase